MENSVILRPTEAAKYLGVCKGAVYAFVREGTLPKPIKLGKRASGWRKSTLDKFIDEREQESR